MSMRNAIARETRTKFIFSHVFLCIFYCKMLISIAPIIKAHLDPESINAVIMQLEIEDNSKPTDVKQFPVKEYLTGASHNSFAPRCLDIESQKVFNTDHAKHIQAFYPAVPTPPPNA